MDKNKSESFEEKRKLKHGRFEKRSVRIIKENDDYSLGVNPLLKWKNLKTIIEISAERIDQKTGEVQNSKDII
ncbi:MAG: hypothetical protein HOP07_07975 [Bacteriovoracaceae bacterium]|nr:hypothetical protein [Bacteriovoracaceae bacterium]